MFIYSVNSISVKRELLCKCNTSTMKESFVFHKKLMIGAVLSQRGRAALLHL